MKQMQRLIIVFALLIALSTILAACGGGDEETPEATTAPVVEATAVPPTAVPPTATAVPPTATAVPPTNTPEPTAVPDVSASFEEMTNEDVGVTIGYPAGWVTEMGDDGSLGLASSEEMLANTDDFIQDGMIVRMMNLPADMLAFLVTEGDPSDPVAVLNAFSTLLTQMSGTEEDVTFTPRDAAVATTIGGFDAATGLYDVLASGQEGVVKLVTIADPDNNRFLLVFGGTPLATEAENLPILDEMLNTISLSTPAVALEPIDPTGTTEITVPGETEGFLLPGDVVESSLEDEDGDSWSYIGLEEEVIDVIVEPVGELDLMVDVVDAEGNSIIGGAQDASFGTETIEALTFPAAGSYIIIVSGFDGALGDYSLTVVETGGGTTSGPTGGVPPEGDLTIGEPAEGTLEGNETAVWTFGALENQFIDVIVTPLDDDLDVVIDVVDEDGNPITDSPTDASYKAELIPVITIPADGLFGVTVTSFDGTGGDYEVLVRLTNDGQTNSLFFTTDEIEEADEEHNFPFNALEGDIATIIVEPTELEFDVVISIYNDDTDELIEERDASTGIEALTFEVSESGNYYFNVKSFEGTLGNYDTALIGSETVIFELASGDELFGQFGEGALLQYYLGGESGDTFNILAAPDADTDIVLRITDLEGNVLAELDDAFSGEAEELDFTFGDEGLVIIELVDFWEELGTFTLTIE